MFAQISQRICWLELVLWVAKQPSFLRMDDRLLHMSMCRLIWLVAGRTSSIVGNAIPRLIFYMRQQKAKLTIKLVWSAKTQISLYIRPVWQGFSFILFCLFLFGDKFFPFIAGTFSEGTLGAEKQIKSCLPGEKWKMYQVYPAILISWQCSDL